MNKCSIARKVYKQKGAVAAELAVTMVVFMGLIVAIIEFSRVMYVFNAASEATRLGARLAATCSDNALVTDRVNSNILNLGTTNYSVVTDSSMSVNVCDATNTSDCQMSQLVGFEIKANTPLTTFDWFIPNLVMPKLTTTIPTEYSGC